MTRIDVPRDRIEEFCRQNHIRKLSFFGSVLRSDFGKDSDIDVLVEFEYGFTPGLRFFAMEQELALILRRDVDLNTPDFLGKNFRDRVLAEAETQYVAP